MATVRYHIRIRGRVQGVGFRVGCREAAHRLGVTGTVRNLPDGTVEIFGEGSEEVMEEFLAWCRVGPRHARVDGVESSSEPPSGAQTFTIV